MLVCYVVLPLELRLARQMSLPIFMDELTFCFFATSCMLVYSFFYICVSMIKNRSSSVNR